MHVESNVLYVPIIGNIQQHYMACIVEEIQVEQSGKITTFIICYNALLTNADNCL